MFEQGKINSRLYLFRDSYAKGKYGISNRRNDINRFNSKINTDYCILQYTDHGQIPTSHSGIGKSLYPKLSFIITKVVSFTPGRLDTPFLSKPVFVPPQLIVQDQGGTQFNLLETYRFHYGDGKNGIDISSHENADATLITPCDRAFKLLIANRLPTPYIDKTLLEQKCEVFFMTKENAANRLQDWKQNKSLYMEQEKMIYLERQRNARQRRQEQERQRKKVSDLDNLFK